MLQANVSSPSFPPLPFVPEPAIFDPPYANALAYVLNDSSFPPQTPLETIYLTRRKIIEAILANRAESAHSVSINLFFAWVSMVCLCGVLLFRIQRNRQCALLGDANAANKIVLPAFEPLLWTLGIVNVTLIVAYGIVLLTCDHGSYYNRMTIELAIAVKVFNGLVVVLYMLQPSLSLRTLVHAVGYAFVLSGYTVVVVVLLNIFSTTTNQQVCYWTLSASRWCLALYMMYLIVYPPARASVLSFRLLCLYIVGMVLLLFGMSEAYHRGSAETARILGWIIAIYSAILPVSVWFVLRADTEHWRGMGKRAVELQDTFRRKNGTMHERVSSQGLHVLIEMHRKYIIDFARLQIRDPMAEVKSTNEMNATVYRGFLHTKKIPVAIKVYMPTDFTEETVAAFSHEAALCGALVHPNILHFHGLCVFPPHICLVTELCEASLHDLITTQGPRHVRADASRRQQRLIHIGYLIDAARALAYLHSFSPPFVHRDIKPTNFLVDPHGTIKLTDFGGSRVLSVHGQDVANRVVMTRPRRRTVLEIPTATNYSGLYTAPEVIRARNAGTSYYGEAADVYSFAMTMWDVLHPGMTKHSLASMDHINPSRDSDTAQAVLAGHRPPVSPLVHPRLRDLLTAGWHADPRRRPTAQAVVSTIEAIQDELCASFALDFMEDMNTHAVAHIDGSVTFAGTQAVEKLRVAKFVASQTEAVRLGNMLMDCGFLHHTKHTRRFEYTDAHYMFDVDQIVACQPLAVLESNPDVPNDRVKVHPNPQSVGPSAHRGRVDMHSSRMGIEHRCACRLLGQHIETEVTTRRRFLRQFKTTSEENLLTANLLTDDLQSTPTGDWATSTDYQPHKVSSDVV